MTDAKVSQRLRSSESLLSSLLLQIIHKNRRSLALLCTQETQAVLQCSLFEVISANLVLSKFYSGNQKNESET